MTIEELHKQFEGATINITKYISKPIKHIMLERIVCEQMGVSREQMRSPRRYREGVYPRFFYMYLLKKYTTYTLAKIGYLAHDTEGRSFNHATVLYAVKTVTNLVNTERKYRELLETIEHNIKLIGA